MTRPRRALGSLLVVAVAVACSPIVADEGSDVPVNTCADCGAYKQAGVTCLKQRDACVVNDTFAGLVFAVSLSQDSYFDPGDTFVVPSAAVTGIQCLSSSTPCDCITNPQVAVGSCAQLPAGGSVQGAYIADGAAAQALDWNLGNPDFTALPVHVTYRALWPQSGLTAASVEADTIGLPTPSIPATVLVNQAGSDPGPNGGESISFGVLLQAGDYEISMLPDPPFDAAFPPDVRHVTVPPGSQPYDSFLKGGGDPTSRTMAGAGVVPPAFDLTRIEGFGDGWTAYLRDAVSLRRISSLATLAGKETHVHVTLATNHDPADGDALTGLELVMQPPAGQAIPTGVFPPIPAPAGELPEEETYPPLPTLVAVSGSVTGAADGEPVEADLVYEALDIYESDQALPNTANFEYTDVAQARVDETGASTYAIALPPGDYRLSIRPLASTYAVTVVQQVALPPSTHPVVDDLVAQAPTQLSGLAATGDDRSLAGATIEAVPVACPVAASSACLPRQAQTTSASDGSFALALDPGSYQLRIEPQQGTRLPWVVQSISVGPTDMNLPMITVPAPVYAGGRLLDPNGAGNNVSDAVVRAYLMQTQGTSVTAVEVGIALTDQNGQFDMYLAPQQ